MKTIEIKAKTVSINNEVNIPPLLKNVKINYQDRGDTSICVIFEKKKLAVLEVF